MEGGLGLAVEELAFGAALADAAAADSSFAIDF